MARQFTYPPSPSRIIFSSGAVANVEAILRDGGYKRAFVLTTPQQSEDGRDLVGRLGAAAAGLFSEAAMHTPVAITIKALDAMRGLGVDCIVGMGGGSTIGLGKAIAHRTGLPQVAIPTTYAGSEVTPILGQTENGLKTTLRDSRLQPAIVIYDAELTLGLPIAVSIASGYNALAHAVEGLYASDRNPISTLMALEACKALTAALPRLTKDPTDLCAREDALYGAWLSGTVLGQLSMSLHHKICHTIGGSFEMPHAQTHTVMLPHTAGFNAVAVPALMRPLEDILGGPVGVRLFELAASLGAPSSLRQLGFAEENLDRAADIAMLSPYENPRPFDREDIRTLLQQAWEGRLSPDQKSMPVAGN